MESQELMEGERVEEGNVSGLDGDEGEQAGLGENVGENLEDELLVDLDTYLDDIDDRLMISRMVSDSVIKGMVNAVEQEAAEKIAAKELKVANMEEILKFHNVDFDAIESFGPSMIEDQLESIRSGRGVTFEEACSVHDKMGESLKGLSSIVREQFKNLEKGIVGAGGCSSIKSINSGSELVGLGGILWEKESESWVDVDRMLDTLTMTLENICYQAYDMLRLSKSTLSQWHWERDLQEELENMVMHSSIQTIQEEFEQKLWSESALLSGSQSVDWIEKFSQISDVRKELAAMLKSLSHSETEQLSSHGSHDADHFHRRALSNHINSSSSLWDGNGKLEGSTTDVPENYEAVQLKHLNKEELVAHFNNIITKLRRDHESTVHQLTEDYYSLKREYLKLEGSTTDVPENYEAVQLKHLNKEELVAHFNNIITKLRRDHESTVHQLTEDYYSLKREYLKERGSCLPHKKDKEFDLLRKRIPAVILKLDDILEENEKPPASNSNTGSFHDLKDRPLGLLSGNHQLKDSLRDRKNEVKLLSSQVADAAEKRLEHSIVEANSALEDAHIEAAVIEDIYKCVVSEIARCMKCATEESDLKYLITQQVYDIVLKGVVAKAEVAPTFEFEDSELESLIAQGIFDVLLRESLKNAVEELNTWYGKYLTESQSLRSLEVKAVEKDNQLKSEAEHHERLKQELAVSVQEKEKFAMDISKERERFELATLELRTDASQQKLLVSQRTNELELVRDQLAEASSQIEADKVKIQILNKKLKEAYQDLEEADNQRKMELALNQAKHASFLLMKSKEREQMEAVIVDVQGLLKMLADFECKVTGKMKANSLRVEDSSSQLNSLVKKANSLKRTGRMYQQRLERKRAHLQKAEAEVDLLGDKVDKFHNLLEKIYIALDHYSPVLRHYPGVMETLKLIRRELTGESMKQRQFSPC
ncbi:WPP domain-associated protein [Coffea arabica]|uniref:WPP domain-associated protein-like isoform X1 n=1 Tax=Coffea arabica TaxID=13443 RepID=A0A6P6UGP6_COFAR|nr:WPP domain-associated protein-like isoform X1 [Coffea arabica]XP_027089018.1 WPP domain-associated protein-like isoform X1 [Coffea arabica]